MLLLPCTSSVSLACSVVILFCFSSCLGSSAEIIMTITIILFWVSIYCFLTLLHFFQKFRRCQAAVTKCNKLVICNKLVTCKLSWSSFLWLLKVTCWQINFFSSPFWLVGWGCNVLCCGCFYFNVLYSDDSILFIWWKCVFHYFVQKDVDRPTRLL